jgi:hypothetical protein
MLFPSQTESHAGIGLERNGKPDADPNAELEGPGRSVEVFVKLSELRHRLAAAGRLHCQGP